MLPSAFNTMPISQTSGRKSENPHNSVRSMVTMSEFDQTNPNSQ